MEGYVQSVAGDGHLGHGEPLAQHHLDVFLTHADGELLEDQPEHIDRIGREEPFGPDPGRRQVHDVLVGDGANHVFGFAQQAGEVEGRQPLH